MSVPLRHTDGIAEEKLRARPAAAYLLRDAHLHKHERVIEGQLVERVVAAR